MSAEMKQFIRYILSTTLVLMLSGTPVLAQRRVSGGGTRGSARTSVNQNQNVNRNNNVNANRNVNVNQNTNVNRNVNVNVHNDVDVHGGYYGGYGGCCYHPVAVAAAVTATAMVTAAVIGSVVHSVPPSCSAVIVNGLTYQHCGSTWYQPQFVGTTASYVVVTAPH
jgi:hypothetical protein